MLDKALFGRVSETGRGDTKFDLGDSEEFISSDGCYCCYLSTVSV